MSPSLLLRCALVAVLLLTPLISVGLTTRVSRTAVGPDQGGNGDYNARFTFSRIRYSGPGYGFRRGGGSWAHDYPLADENLPTVLSEISVVRPTLGRSNVFDLEDRTFFQYPIIYLSEPGYWGITDEGARNLREYLLKGGFIIFDDFEAEQWRNFKEQFQRALPEYEFIELDVRHPIFHSFFDLEKLDTPHPLVRVTPVYYGVFENNDPTQRMMAMVNYNSDLAEYWEWSGRGYFPIDPTNDAYKMGINYIVYGLTH
jgi:hypothetical protein